MLVTVPRKSLISELKEKREMHDQIKRDFPDDLKAAEQRLCVVCRHINDQTEKCKYGLLPLCSDGSACIYYDGGR